MKRDNARREKNARVDTEVLQYTVQGARKVIYEQGRGVKSTAVENMLQRESLVPTKASTTR